MLRTLLLSCVLLWAGPAAAVVITTGDGSGNTTAPPDDPGFANVGPKGSTGVYIGNGWVMTAAHVGVGSGIQLGGIQYAPLPGSEVQISQGGTLTDLLMFRILNPPALPALTLATAPPQIGDDVVMIGHGNDRQPGLTYWDENWVEVIPPTPFTYVGYQPIFNRTVRWGNNVVTSTGVQIPIGGTDNIEFCTTFDSSGVTHEAQVAPGDSGGAAFRKNGGNWELLGILDTRFGFQGQPFNASIFGSLGCSIDLTAYSAEIAAVLTPPVPAAAAPLRAALAIALLSAAGFVLANRRR